MSANVVAFAVVNVATGVIVRYGSCPADFVALQAGAGQIALEIAADVTDTTHWYDGGEIVARMPLPEFDTLAVPADGATAATVTGLPNPTNVRITGAATDEFVVTDGTLDLSFDVAGVYFVRLDAGVQYVPREAVISAT